MLLQQPLYLHEVSTREPGLSPEMDSLRLVARIPVSAINTQTGTGHQARIRLQPMAGLTA
jgi:hypothetical protein